MSVSTKSTTLSKDKRNHCGKALFCVFPPIPPFRRKPAPQTALPLLTAVFLFKVPLRRHMSAYVTNFKIYSILTGCIFFFRYFIYYSRFQFFFQQFSERMSLFVPKMPFIFILPSFPRGDTFFLFLLYNGLFLAGHNAWQA